MSASSTSSTIRSAKTANNVKNGPSFLQTLSSILDADFQKATPTASNIDISTPAGSLNIVYTNSPDMAKVIGQHVAAYWAKTTQPSGGPVKDAIESVSNNASGIAGPIESGIRNLKSGNGSLAYNDIVEVIFSNVKTIVWEITETDAGGVTHNLTANVT